MLDINPMLLLATLVVFLALIATLNSWLYNPLFSYIDKRDGDIKSDLEQVGSSDDEIRELEAKAKSIIDGAKLEAVALREKVVAEAKALAQSKIDTKKSELATQYAEFEKLLSQSKEQLKAELESQVPLFKESIKTKLSMA